MTARQPVMSGTKLQDDAKDQNLTMGEKDDDHTDDNKKRER
jgi:hypothetical protein